ncbi:MAG: Inorganic pyrophosphatase [Solobacterium sp.]|nr:Inorganic pyrophosphatase [Erysipelotrichaceae bacterium]MBQ9153015.1 Inorganic pyrophosphatase [Solobacterium sp.]
MAEYENNAYFWQKVDTLFLSSDLKVSRKKGETHPRFKNLIYPVDYGRLADTAEVAPEVSVYIGSEAHTVVTALVVAADILQKTLDVKILVGCTEEETDAVLRFLNQTDYQKTVLIRRGSSIPSWGLTDN